MVTTNSSPSISLIVLSFVNILTYLESVHLIQQPNWADTFESFLPNFIIKWRLGL